MSVYRLCKCRYARDLSGRGAEMAGGRWNSKGTPVLYTAGSRALSTVEIAVHTPLGNIPKDYCMVILQLPDVPVQEIDPSSLPEDWRSLPPSASTRKRGDRFIAEGKELILKVPSAVVEGDFNYLINPRHKEASKIKILSVTPFSFDKRLFQHSG